MPFVSSQICALISCYNYQINFSLCTFFYGYIGILFTVILRRNSFSLLVVLVLQCIHIILYFLTNMSYSPDVETISQMFEGMDKSVIQAVYNVNNNNLERTIDNLLAMNSAGEQQSQAQSTESSSARSDNTFYNNMQQNNDSIPVSSSLAEARALERRRQQGISASNANVSTVSMNGYQRSNTTTLNAQTPAKSRWRNPLPSDFLRLAPEFIESRSRSSSQPKMKLRDEELARMLQNEIFREQLKEDPLFNRLMAQDREQQRLRAERQRAQKNRHANSNNQNNNNQQQSDGNNSNGNSWFSSMGDGLKSFISGKYRDSRKRSQKRKENRREKQNEGEDKALLLTAKDEYNNSGDETDEENVPLFDENHDDGLGEGFELGTWKSNNNDDVLTSTPKSSPNSGKKKTNSKSYNGKKKAFSYGGRQQSLDDVDDLL